MGLDVCGDAYMITQAIYLTPFPVCSSHIWAPPGPLLSSPCNVLLSPQLPPSCPRHPNPPSPSHSSFILPSLRLFLKLCVWAGSLSLPAFIALLGVTSVGLALTHTHIQISLQCFRKCFESPSLLQGVMEVPIYGRITALELFRPKVSCDSKVDLKATCIAVHDCCFLHCKTDTLCIQHIVQKRDPKPPALHTPGQSLIKSNNGPCKVAQLCLILLTSACA